MDTLRFALTKIPGASAASLAQVYFDFIVSDNPLSQLLQLEKAHQSSVFYCGQDGASVARRIKLFTAQHPPAPGRPQFFVCAECGDAGCGAVTASIQIQGNVVTWQDFGWNFGDGEPDANNDEPIGPFVFDKAAYFAVFADLQAQLLTI